MILKNTFAKTLFIIAAFAYTILRCECLTNEEEQRIARLFRTLADTFAGIRQQQQFGVLYVPTPTEPNAIVLDGRNLNNANDVNYLQNAIATRNENNITFPYFPSDFYTGNYNDYGHNYVAVIPDRNGLVYRQTLGVNRRRDIHTEQLALELVLPRIITEYVANYARYPDVIYLYTYFLPCPNCVIIIQRTLESILINTTLYVGYTEFGGVRNENHQLAQTRENQIQNLLNNNNGGLFNLANLVDGCYLPGGGSGSIRKRKSVNTCDMNAEIDITMDFQTGEAKAEWFEPGTTGYSRSYVELLDKSGSSVTYEWIDSTPESSVTFKGHYIQDGMSVRAIRNSLFTRKVSLQTSTTWRDCGYGWRVMNKLPDNYGRVFMGMRVENGYPVIGLAICNGKTKPAENDVITLQIYGANGDEDKEIQRAKVITMTAVHKDVNHILVHKFPNRLNAQFATGFRAKYIRIEKGRIYGQTEYPYTKYDNAIPYWLPGECGGMAKYAPKATKIIDDNTDPCAGASSIFLHKLATILACFLILINSFLLM